MNRATHTDRPLKLDLREIDLLADSIFMKELEMPRLLSRECDKINLQFRVGYGSRVKELNILEVWITDREFEPIPGEEQVLQ